ncbi:hypothetical protein ACSZN3_14320 [Aeromonas hydrophila]|uniref:hypothetical protein n=1 Tax=Aeromonas hydrophila TaxID=644 RepID=UPI003D3DC97F
MDIYQKIVAELSVEPLAFDKNGVCTFEIQRAAEEATAPFVVNIVAQPHEMALVLSVTTASDLPERLSRELFLRFGEHALAPLRHGYGVGIYPGTERVSFFPRSHWGTIARNRSGRASPICWRRPTSGRPACPKRGKPRM